MSHEFNEKGLLQEELKSITNEKDLEKFASDAEDLGHDELAKEAREKIENLKKDLSSKIEIAETTPAYQQEAIKESENAEKVSEITKDVDGRIDKLKAETEAKIAEVQNEGQNQAETTPVTNSEVIEKKEEKSFEELSEEYTKIGEKILEAPKRILRSMTQDEIKLYSQKYPNEAPYLNEMLNGLDKFRAENSSFVFENFSKYIKFLGEIRGEDYSKEVLSFPEVEALRLKQSEIVSKQNETTPVTNSEVTEEKPAEGIAIEK